MIGAEDLFFKRVQFERPSLAADTMIGSETLSRFEMCESAGIGAMLIWGERRRGRERSWVRERSVRAAQRENGGTRSELKSAHRLNGFINQI